MSYFEALSQTLKMHMDETTFPDDNGYIVDPDTVVEGESGSGVVCVVGKAFFESVKTGKSWQEQFILFVYCLVSVPCNHGRQQYHGCHKP